MYIKSSAFKQCLFLDREQKQTFLPTEPVWKFWGGKQQTKVFLRLAVYFIFVDIHWSMSTM